MTSAAKIGNAQDLCTPRKSRERAVVIVPGIVEDNGRIAAWAQQAQFSSCILNSWHLRDQGTNGRALLVGWWNEASSGLRSDGCPFIVVTGTPSSTTVRFQTAGGDGLTREWDVPAAAFTVTILNPEVSGSLAGRAQYRAEFSTIEERSRPPNTALHPMAPASLARRSWRG